MFDEFPKSVVLPVLLVGLLVFLVLREVKHSRPRTRILLGLMFRNVIFGFAGLFVVLFLASAVGGYFFSPAGAKRFSLIAAAVYVLGLMILDHRRRKTR